jgi:hypothetical protein
MKMTLQRFVTKNSKCRTNTCPFFRSKLRRKLTLPWVGGWPKKAVQFSSVLCCHASRFMSRSSLFDWHENRVPRYCTFVITVISSYFIKISLSIYFSPRHKTMHWNSLGMNLQSAIFSTLWQGFEPTIFCAGGGLEDLCVTPPGCLKLFESWHSLDIKIWTLILHIT